MWKAKSQVISSLFIVVNSISCFLLTLVLIINILYGQNDTLSFEHIVTISASYFGGLILSSIIGGTLLAKILQKKSALLFWNLMGFFSCLLFYFFYSQANLDTVSILSLILGFSIGLGIPSCLSLFATQSKTEKRGRLGAVVFFTIQIISALILLPLGGEAIAFQFLVIAVWRLAGLGGFLFYKSAEKNPDERKTSLSSIVRERKFILLFLPWFMFTIINYIETPVLEIGMSSIGPDFYTTYNIVNIMIISIAAIPAGILCDLKGRKITGIAGFIFLGLGYAFLSIFSGAGILAYIFFMVFDGIAWGLLYVNFIFVIWGDLSEGSSREKYYVLGGLPFLLSGLIQVLVQPFAQYINIGLSFSFASFFLFIAMLPLVFAPESLSDKIMKQRELNNYIQKALNTVSKKKPDEKKQPEEKENKDSGRSNSEEDENGLETEEDKKARELAEKYY
jgi:MFS family permease